MNSKTKRRMMAVTGVIIIVVIVILAVVGSQGAATSVTIADVLDGKVSSGQKIQVTGKVVDNSYETKDNVLTFAIFPEDTDDQSQQLQVRYEGGVSATFGNEVTAICTGKMGDDGVLHCTTLVTKCPSKYENATEALTVSSLLGYGDAVVDKVVKVTGTVQSGSLKAAGAGNERFVLEDTDGTSETLGVAFDGALANEVAEGSQLVVTGSLGANGTFTATDVAISK